MTLYLWRKTNSWFSWIFIDRYCLLFRSFLTWHHYKIHCTTPYLDVLIIGMLNMASPIYCTQPAFLFFAKLLGFYFFNVSPLIIVVAVILRTSIVSGLDEPDPYLCGCNELAWWGQAASSNDTAQWDHMQGASATVRVSI